MTNNFDTNSTVSSNVAGTSSLTVHSEKTQKLNSLPSPLDGFRVLVTGSSRGIGAGIAKLLAESGARVAVTYGRSKESAEKILAELSGSGHIMVALDISDETSVQICFETVVKEFGGLDGLVNNAGVTADQLLLRMKKDDFEQVVSTNLTGTFLCTKAAVKIMLKARIGSIVNITSVIGQSGNPGQANYAASKAGIEAFSKSVAQEVASRHIRVNCVAPGFIQTDMTGALNEAQQQSILSKVPLNALGDVNDVAYAVRFLLSSESKYITGQTIGVNGGLYM